MKRIKKALVCGVILALAGAPTMLMADVAKRAASATVRRVTGTATYTAVSGGQAMPLRPNAVLDENATIMTGAGATVDLQVNGYASTVRVTENTTMTLKTMENLGAGDTETMLNLDKGTVLGSVRKISKNSRYEVETGRGVAGIRGTDFAVTSIPNPNGRPTVTFSSVTGTVYCTATVLIAGVPTPVSKTLTTGQSWTPPDTGTSVQQVETAPPAPLPPGINPTVMPPPPPPPPPPQPPQPPAPPQPPPPHPGSD